MPGGPPALWVLAHPQCVEYNERRTLALAALVPARMLRSGRVRRLPPPRRRLAPRRPSPAAASPAASPPALRPASPSPAPPPPMEEPEEIPPLAGEPPGSPLFEAGGGGDDDDDDEFGAPTGLRTPSPPPPPFPFGSRAAFEQRQVGLPLDVRQRIPWDWAESKSNEDYVPYVADKWWSDGNIPVATQHRAGGRDYGHIGRIMETELGEQLEGSARCTHCQEAGYECWQYTKEGALQVSRPGDSCARCRVVARKGGCSLSKRKRPSAPFLGLKSSGPRSLARYGMDKRPPGDGGAGLGGVMT